MESKENLLLVPTTRDAPKENNYDPRVSRPTEIRANSSSEPAARGRARANAGTITSARTRRPAPNPGKTSANHALVPCETTRASKASQTINETLLTVELYSLTN